VGILGGIIDTTIVEKILQLDLLKTDYFHDASYPTFLYFNPFNENKLGLKPHSSFVLLFHMP